MLIVAMIVFRLYFRRSCGKKRENHWLGELVLNEWKQDTAQLFLPPYVPS